MRALLLLCFIGIPGFVFPQNKLALIVAIGEYAPGSSIRPIASVNDVKYIKSALRRNGFTDKNIDTLINAKATKDAILMALTRLADKARKNDIIVIHFACHGQQIRDQKTIELGKDEDDGYDEALLPYDAKSKYNPTGYRGEKHLRDDDLFPKLMAIRQKIGAQGSLLVLLDACHSGTGTRAEGFAITRGMPDVFPDPENPMDSVINLSEANQVFFETLSDSISNMVVISGSSPHQENKQLVVNKEDLGALSYSFYKAINEMPADGTYELLFEKIKANIQAQIPDQVPMIEGNTNQLLFSGKYASKEEKTYVRVGYKGNEDTVFVIERGMMDNMMPGTTGQLFKAGTNLPFANAVIRKAENFKSIGVADKKLVKADLYEFKPTAENYGGLQAAIKLNYNRSDLGEKQMMEQVKEFIKPYSFLSFSEQADFQLELKPVLAGKRALLTDRNNDTVWTSDISNYLLSADEEKQMIKGIKRSLRVKYLRTLPDGGDLQKDISASIVPAQEYQPSRGVYLVAGDLYSLNIRNNSKQNLYYTVLDIYPNDEVEVLYPYKGKEPADYLVEANSTVTRKLKVSSGSPTGVEFLKIIVSKEPMDLRSVFEKTVRRDRMQSFQTALDDLFNDKEGKPATRADVSSIKVEEVGIITVSFTIKKP